MLLSAAAAAAAAAHAGHRCGLRVRPTAAADVAARQGMYIDGCYRATLCMFVGLLPSAAAAAAVRC
jgi:hypothetical protein